jgi:hypothetical protein
MQGRTVKSAAPGTRGSCTGNTTLTCATEVNLHTDTCQDKAVLGFCGEPQNLKARGTRATGYCCGGGQLVVGGSLHSCGSGESLCNTSGDTLHLHPPVA